MTLHGALMGLGLAWQAISPEAAEHARAGLAARQAGNLSAATDEFKKVTELAPTLPAAFVNLGALYIERKDYPSAVSPLQHAVEMDPNLKGAQQMLGFSLLQVGRAAEAVPYLQSVGATDLLGLAELKLGRLKEAILHLQQALEKRPDDPELLYALGRASGLLSKEVFDNLEARYPESARSHQALAENLAVLRRVPDTEAEYKAALAAAPDTRGLHLALGQVYAQASDWPKAEAEFQAEAKLEPDDAETQYRLGAALLEEGKLSEASAALKRSDALRPDMPETLYALGKTASLQNDGAAATAAWQKQLKIEPESPLAAQAHFGLAALYRKTGKAEAAVTEMNEFRRLQKSTPK
jgi:tetratricopeptide (TPR) repeat protein